MSGKTGKRHGFLRVVTVNRSGKIGKRFRGKNLAYISRGKYRERKTKLAKTGGISREKSGNDFGRKKEKLNWGYAWADKNREKPGNDMGF